jgi:hypothetical protein
MATNIPAAVATKASLITGAIAEKLTLEIFLKLANDSKIPTTVPNNPIKGAVEAIIDCQDNPELASLIIEISKTSRDSLFILLSSPMKLPMDDKGLSLNSLFDNTSRVYRSLFIEVDNSNNLYIKIKIVKMRYTDKKIRTESVMIELFCK